MKLPSFVKRSSRTKSPWCRTILLIAALVLIAVIPGVYFALRNPDFAKAAIWYNNAWTYRKQVNLTGISSSQTDFPTKITVDTATLISANKMQSTCADVRFADANGKLLPYWIETGTNACNTATTIIWVKVPSVPTTGATIYFYYGNSNAASAANGDNVFDFFDDFSSGTLNTTKWTTNGTNSNSAGEQTITTGAIYTNTAITPTTQNRIFEARAKWTTLGSYSGIVTSNTNSVNGGNGNLNKMSGLFSNGVTNIQQMAFAGDGSSASYNVVSNVLQYTPTSNTYYYTGFLYDGTTVKYLQNRTVTNSYATSVQYSPFVILGYFAGSLSAAADGTDLTVDFVDVRKYVATEPTATFASEEVNTPPLLYYKFNDGTGTTAKDSSLNANDGTLGGTTIPTWQNEEMCVSGKCLYFDGTTSKVTGSKIVKGVQTVAFWVRPTNTNVTVRGYLNLDGGTHKITADLASALTATGFSSPTYYINGVATTSPVLVNGQWNYVEITTATPFNTTSSFLIGSDGSNFTKGFMGEVKFYNYVRSAAQARSDYIQTAPIESSLSNGLVGYWKFNEYSGAGATLVDSSGASNDLTAMLYGGGNTSTDSAHVTGKFGHGFSFDGGDDRLRGFTTTSVNPTTAITLSSWVNTTTISGAAEIINKKTDSGLNGYRLRRSGATIVFEYSDGTTAQIQTTTGVVLTANAWYHVAATYDGKFARIYVNGVEVTNAAHTGTIANNVGFLYVGAYQNLNAYWWSGTLDETRIYNRALSATEVGQLANFAPGPVASWSFDENSGTSVFDRSGNNATGTWGGTNLDQWVAGKYGAAGNFNGVSSYVNATAGSATATNFLQTDSFSVGAWVKTNTTASQIIFSKQENVTNELIFALSTDASNHAQFNLAKQNVSGNVAVGSTVLSTNQWYYLEGTYNGSVINIYVNGVLDGTTTVSFTSATQALAAIDLGRAYTGSTFFNGQIDEVKVFNYVRNQTQMLDEMRGNATGVGSSVGTAGGATSANSIKSNSASLYWKMDELNGSTANNTGSSGTAGNGTVTGAVWQTGTNCKLNGCIYLDTNTDKVSAGDTAFTDGLTQMTVSMWINPTSLAAASEIFGKYNDGTQESFLISTAPVSSSDLAITVASSLTDVSNYYVTTNLGLTAGTWQQITIVYDGTQSSATNRIKIYRNGILANGTYTGTIPTSLTSGSTSNLILGNTDLSAYTALVAKYDEVQIIPAALTADQVKVQNSLGFATGYAVGATREVTTDVGGNPPVAYWNMDEHTGSSTYDQSGNGYTGSFVSSPTWVYGKIGSALNFNGGTQQVTTTYATAMGDFTVCAWFKYTGGPSGTGYGRIADKTYDNGWWLGRNNQVANQWGGGVKETTGQFGIFVTLPDGQWNHICSIRSGTTHYIVGNGGAVINSNTVTSGATSTAIIRIGNDGNGASGFTGVIDEVKVYDYARSMAQIAYDYNRGAPIAWWKADECSGTTLNDASGNANTGTITIGGSGTTPVGDCNTASTAWGNGASGKFNSAISLDGTDDSVSFGDLSSAESVSQLSWSFWVKPTALATQKVLWAKANIAGTQDSWAFATSPSDSSILTFLLSASTTDLSTGATSPAGVLSNGTWTHIVAVFDGSQSGNANRLKIYANGKLLNVTYSGTIPATTTATTSNSTLGVTNDSFGYFNGLFDDVRLYNYPLSVNQINKLYNGGFGTRVAPLTGNP